MLLIPKRTKFKKYRKGGPLKNRRTPHKSKKTDHVATFSLKYGSFGLVSKRNWRLTAQQIEATRRTVAGSLRRSGRIWLRTFPDIPVTAKPVDARMGKGKGAVSYWVSKVKPGQILFEITGVNEESAKRALLKGSKKLPFCTTFISRLGPRAL